MARDTGAGGTVARAVPPASESAAGGPPSVLVEPDAGIDPIYTLLRSPKHTLDVTMYEFVDPTAEQILAADAARGVVVRVVLDTNLERSRNAPAYHYLATHHVAVHWASKRYDATHEKAFVIDAAYADATAVLMSLNLTSEYYSDTRDAAVVDHDSSDVAAVESVFAADFAGNAIAPTPHGADLVWSPGSEPALAKLIGSAHYSVAVENEEMSDYDIVDALASAARSRVTVRVVMTDHDEYTSEFGKLLRAGATVHLFPDTWSALYIHAKVIVVDAGHADERAFVGSENFSYRSLGHNRELGLITSNRKVVNTLAKMVAGDYTKAPAYH